jgi:glucan 1,3-beta-glucosidase
MSYFIQTFEWAKQEKIDIFYFSSFEEAWKAKDEGEYGVYWGLWDKDGFFKF